LKTLRHQWNNKNKKRRREEKVSVFGTDRCRLD